MKNYIIVLIIFTSISVNAQSKSSHFPLEKGNKWFYSWVPTIDSTIRTSLEVISDTLMPDGKWYSRIDKFDKKDSTWERTIGFCYLREENNILYKFPSDTLLNYDWTNNTTNSELNGTYSKVNIEEKDIFGKRVLTYFLYYNDYEGISISDSIGYFDLYALSWRDWLQSSRQLVGCIINKINYGSITGIYNNEKSFPIDYQLFQNYPNPFNPSTIIKYVLPMSGKVTLKLYNILGKEILTLVNKYETVGEYEVELNMKNYPSGVYFYTLSCNSYTKSKKLLLLR